MAARMDADAAKRPTAPARLAVARAIAARIPGRGLFAAVLVFCYGYFFSPANTNTLSRYDMVVALAQGTAIIDPLRANTIDVSFYAGHYYSPRSLGPSLLAVPVYKLLARLATATATQPTVTFDIGYFNLFTAVPVCVACALVFAAFVARLRPALAGTALPLVAASAFALGTLFFPFATVFFGHAFAGALAFTGFYLLYRARPSLRRGGLLVALAGLLVGYAVISEYPLAVVALILCGYVAAVFPQERWRMLALFVAGALPCALLLAGYNWLAFGSPLHLSYAYVTGGQFQGQHGGLFGVTLPSLGGLIEILAWPRGLLVESPFLIFVPLGLVRWWRGSARPSPEVVVCAAITVVYPLLVASYYLPMAGENLPGPRLLVPMLPFTCLALAWVVGDPRRWLRATFAALLACGFALSALYVLLGVREYHTYLTYPLDTLFGPLLRTGLVPALNGPTPQSFGTQIFQLSWLASLRVFLVPLIAWCAYVVYRAATAHPVAPPPSSPPLDATPSAPLDTAGAGS
ncbi:MAG: hypothetical protein ACHQ4H_01355 [Ktedonobacterales bacterium]